VSGDLGAGQRARHRDLVPAGGYRSEEFRAASRASPAIIFICPYGTSISTLRWAIRRVRRAGYHVMAYETTTAVFMAADPAILRDLISAMRKDLEVADIEAEVGRRDRVRLLRQQPGIVHPL
jgi:hypothetical protein